MAVQENHIFCERCGQPLNHKRVVWLELSNTDGKYYKINELTERSIPEGYISQGAFTFGKACSIKQLKETKDEQL